MIRINGTVALVFTFNKKFFSTLNHFTQIFFIHMKSWIIWLLFFYSMAKLWATMSKLGWKWRVSCIKTPQDWGSFGCLVLSNLPRSHSLYHIITTCQEVGNWAFVQWLYFITKGSEFTDLHWRVPLFTKSQTVTLSFPYRNYFCFVGSV